MGVEAVGMGVVERMGCEVRRQPDRVKGQKWESQDFQGLEDEGV